MSGDERVNVGVRTSHPGPAATSGSRGAGARGSQFAGCPPREVRVARRKVGLPDPGVRGFAQEWGHKSEATTYAAKHAPRQQLLDGVFQILSRNTRSRQPAGTAFVQRF